MKKILLTLFMIASWSATAHASGFNVFPVRVELSARKTTASLELTNTSDTPTVVQLEPTLWEQEEGRMKLTPTEDVLAVPPVFTIQPGKKQVIRLALKRPVDVKKEMTYRLFINEVPSEVKSASEGVSVAINVGIPIFVAPKTGDARPRLEWSAQKINEKQIRLTLANKGNAHIQIGLVNIYSPEGEKTPIFDKTLAVYVLAGQTGTWVLDLDAPLTTGSILLKAKTDDLKVEERLRVE